MIGAACDDAATDTTRARGMNAGCVVTITDTTCARFGTPEVAATDTT